MSEIRFDSQPEGRFDRHQLISWWDQERLSRARVIVAGAGALGNEVLKLLALIGVGNITVLDYDVVSLSNLSRMVLFRQQDVGRPKVEVAVERLREINPEVTVRGVNGDLRYSLGLGDYREADLVFGCLDSVNARWALNRQCFQAGVEWLDSGISDYHGLVARYSPRQGACYECTFTAATLERFNQRYSCPFGLLAEQGENKVPTTAVTSSAIAALQVQQALLMLHGIEAEALQPGERLMLYFKPFHLVRDRLPENPDCLAHFTLPEDIPQAAYSLDWTVDDVLHLAYRWYPQVEFLDLGYDLVTGFYCSNCDQQQAMLRLKDSVFQHEARCPQCGELRQPEIASIIQVGSPLCAVKLRDLHIPPHHILAFGQGEQRFYLHMQND